LSGFDYCLVNFSDPKVLLKPVASCATEAVPNAS
jgi:hypothetical protein